MRTIVPTILSLVVILGFSVCQATAQTSTNTPVHLKPAMFIDYEFTLISSKDHLYYYFQENGSVSETFGQKALIGLAEGWRIEHSDTLVFTGVAEIAALPGSAAVPNPVRHTLQFKSFGENIVVTTDGQKFKRSKIKRPD